MLRAKGPAEWLTTMHSFIEFGFGTVCTGILYMLGSNGSSADENGAEKQSSHSSLWHWARYYAVA